MTFSEIVRAEEAALNIEVRVWERARQIVDCLIVSQRSVILLKEKLRLATSNATVVLADVEEARRKFERRRDSHAQLIAAFGQICREVGDAVDGLTQNETI